MTKLAIEKETEKLRQLVIAAIKSPDVKGEAEATLEKLVGLHQTDPAAFTPEDIRFVNVLRGKLGVRLDAHQKGGPYAPIAKPKMVKLDHCWRCQTALDVRFNAFCTKCATKSNRSLICPVCSACGCQAAGLVMV